MIGKHIDNQRIELSKREIQVLTLAAQGKTYAEISKALAVTEDTAKAHMENASVKLNTTNKTHTVAVAVAKGLIAI